ncbi:DNA cytosine methyltransferase [Phormidesmis priestleyi ULC007]|uniref:Cytosine-specific methyltransferase n=1 Tax=Phormidesmis priestleyi ULC007 TaxID=1920490 RepID=A0A2T1DHX8_9CYAN|nr:DNA cytosine methyltransferase [Phormidesmis priestleyi]PSB20083.1 DNA cytosine methyltransferase [Phormidesmis priestleyi ULC007]PZO48947.1 MAG: DNA cytosine methyltransferase [Phormidesmis priestleyi]
MQQLSLSLELLNSEAANTNWFQDILATLKVRQETAWADNFGKFLHRWLRQQGIAPVRTLSLFSGGGGLDIAFHDAGFEIVQMVELEAKYIQTLQKNSQPGKWLEGSKPVCIDIRDYSPDSDLKVDFIIGGPPCQTFSAAGRRAAGVSGTTDARGTLFQEYVRILKLLQPKGFLFENVYGITGANGGGAWQEIQEAFQEAGYNIYFRILDTADYGVPQHRERLFIVGLKQGKYLFPYPTHGFDSLDRQPYYSAANAVEDADISDIETGLGGRFGHLLEDIPPGLNYSFYTKEMGYPNPIFSWRSKFSDFLYKADPDTPVRTIKAQGGQYTGPFSWENRKFSISELKRLQTIPDDYEMIGNRQIVIEQIGNSVPPQLGRILALSILDQVINVELPFNLAYLPQSKKLGFRQRKRGLTKIYLQKAQTAITELSRKGKFTDLADSIYENKGESVRFLSVETFSWTKELAPDCVKIYLNYELSDSSWTITASTSGNWEEPDQFIIDVYPSCGHDEWVLGANSVKLCAKKLNAQVFTSLWKAFEEKLSEATGKADLVQLSGYYQYNARISGVMNFCEKSKVSSFWRVVQCVTRCIGTSAQLKAIEFAEQWGVEEKDIFFYLQSLRAMGYEVRSNNTNPQILAGEYLIPYAFPTLNPKSVQLRKHL